MLPILYQSNGVVFYSYPLFMGLGWGVAYQIFLELLPESLGKKRAMILFWGVFLFAWIGAKTLFLYTIPVALSASLMAETSFWLGGGFIFYGGFLGALLYLLVLRGLKFPLPVEVIWAMVPSLTIGHAIGRFGCFLAGCCYGKETEFFWGIHIHGTSRHPTQLLECASLFFLGFYLLRSSKSKPVLISTYLIGYGVLRLFVENLRGDLIRGTWGPLSPSQWISLVLVGAGILFHLKNIRVLGKV